MIASGYCAMLWISGFVLAAASEPMLPTTTAPIVYTLDYSDHFFTNPKYIERFEAAPPDLLHMGKAAPITHLWGPVRMYRGENQWTGGPKNTLNWENIALLTPEALADRIEHIRETLWKYHAAFVNTAKSVLAAGWRTIAIWTGFAD